MSFCFRFAVFKLTNLRLHFVIRNYNQWRCLFSKHNYIPARTFNNHFQSKLSNKPQTILFAGILTWLGLKKEEEEEDVLITTIKRGILCLHREEYEKAETILHLALKLAQERQDMEGQRYIFDLLANIAYNKEEFEKAEKLFLQVTKELVASGTSVDDNAIIEISLKLATIYSKTNQDLKAEEGYRYCIETQKKKLNSMKIDESESLSDDQINTTLLLGMSFNWYALHLLGKGSHKTAQENFQKALEISEKINGPSHPQTLTLISDIGCIISLQREYDQAIEWFQKAISRVSNVDNDLPEIATFYCNLGATYFQKGDLSKAKNACSTALKLAKKVKNPEAAQDAKECLAEVKEAEQKP